MLKHVSYRSTSLIGDHTPGKYTCRLTNSSCRSLSSDILIKDLPPTPECPQKLINDRIPKLIDVESNLNRFKEPVRISSDDFKNEIILSKSPDEVSLRHSSFLTKEELERLGSLSLQSFSRSPDTFSLTSAISYSSLATGKYSSRCSSTMSLNDQSGSSPTIPVKIYLRRLRPDMEYKTLALSSLTTCRGLITSLLLKFRLRHRDPNLFFVLMEVSVRSPSHDGPVRRLLALDDNARPAELQQCRPKGEARFSIGVRRGGLVRVHDSVLMAGSKYKSLIISYSSNAIDLVQLLLDCYNLKDNPNHYTIHEICQEPYRERALRNSEFPLKVQANWSKETKDACSFVLRRNINYTLSLKSKLSWRRSLDQSSTDTESELEDHNTTRASIMSSSSTASNSSSISACSSTSGVSSDLSSTCSSSGVSSGDSCLSSPTPSPVKHHHPRCTSTPSSYAKKYSTFPAKIIAPITTIGKPPRPVPRTLFPRFSTNLSMKKDETDSDDHENDSGISVDSVSSRLALPLSPALISPSKQYHRPSFAISPRSNSPKQANIRSLSKSSANLSLISVVSPSKSISSMPSKSNSESKSKSYLNLTIFAAGSPESKTCRVLLDVSKRNTLPNLDRSFSSSGWDISPGQKLSKLSSVSSNNLSHRHVCKQNCKNCFYI